MASVFSTLLPTLVFLFSVTCSAEEIANRSSDVVFYGEGADVPAPLKYDGTFTSLTALLDGRSLIESWLRSGHYTCSKQGWQSCSTQSGCCPTAQLCCPNIPACKTVSSDICCPDYTACSIGWVCTPLCRCIEEGGECCSTGRYCQKENICVVNSYGVHGCCTDLKCTAYVTNSVTVTLTPTYTPIQAATTPAPEPTVTQGIYYYFTITWSYYFYFYFTFVEVVTTSTLTSSYSTVHTTVSIYGTDSADASSSFNSVSSTFIPLTPAAATTALTQLTGSTTSTTATVPPATGAPTVSATLFPTFFASSSSSTSTPGSSLRGSSTSGVGASGVPATGPLSAATIINSWTVVALIGIAFMPGMMMLWL